jgi:hypothetical protein
MGRVFGLEKKPRSIRKAKDFEDRWINAVSGASFALAVLLAALNTTTVSCKRFCHRGKGLSLLPIQARLIVDSRTTNQNP